ncbi:ATP-dependent exoDNAse (exonuclease V) beta subunit [Geothermobacter ehrlichii]|uniref:DNA 3'-5' helicase n=1 Tax=Geothermobacter ehrlichii TaxID=213224 RepID=A0A5D3WN45_9BACT|nr:UvrD-helicase domain-containing protein [Geothermobacter ehrlichii]TYP00291.1 ATP-dependent exoDNAse (exonuclease V) beta subunit [Geothermobacter ehrlichii]
MTDAQMLPSVRPPDAGEREAALDPTRSFIVQAPAGSGKTELLSQRLLRLLAVVDQPEEILAITFTRKAAEEMKGRVLLALGEAASGVDTPGEEHRRRTMELARAALARDREGGWNLLDNPSRLRLTTIDSFCAFLTRRMPWLSRFGGQPQVTDFPDDLYREAVDRLLARLDGQGPEADAVACLLDHLDNRLGLIRDMLVDMLARRDQWLRTVLGKRHEQARQQLETNLRACCLGLLRRLEQALAPWRDELLDLARYAAGNLAGQDDSPLAGLPDRLEDAGTVEARFALWDRLLKLLLTAQGQVRKSVDRRLGFPAGREGAEAKGRMQALLASLAVNDEAQAAMLAYRDRPESRYPDAGWIMLDALVELLPLAVVELLEVFRLTGQVDFVEIAGAALRALGDEEHPEELLLQLDSRIRHILVDEFQDTSIIQFELLRRLTAGWSGSDGRTLFLVGDPMQSIYRFRQAEVSLFLQVCQRGFGMIRPQLLQLSANFRSQQGIVDWVNDTFSLAFPAREDSLRCAIPYRRAVASRPDDGGEAVSLEVQTESDGRREAERIVELVRAYRTSRPEWTVAVLARARSHLSEIVALLKSEGIRFQGQDLDSLAERQSILDLRSLTRALLHPADRISWLALLRAPWCGLTLNDLEAVIAGDRTRSVWELLDEGGHQRELFSRLSEEGHRRWQRIRPSLERALELRGRVPLRRLIEATWLALGGPACVPATELPDTERFFELLDEFDHGGDLRDFDRFDRRLGQLFASPDPGADGRLQLMTIHKAKGLEFDVVILPGLGRTTQSSARPLLNWLDHPDFGLLLASVRRADDPDPDRTYEAIQRIQQDRDREEITRLAYVAATRAKRRLHLFGQVREDGKGELRPAAGSFLERIWPAVAGQARVMETTGTPVTEEPAGNLLWRLPADWRLPQLAPALDTRVATGQLPSDSGDNEPVGVLKISLRAMEWRIVGNLVHQLLERLPDRRPSRKELAAMVPRWEELLVQGGIPWHRRRDAAVRVLRAMENVCHGRHWSRLFGDVSEVQVELALHGMVDGRLQHAAVDRSFVDSDGCRWVVDFKTSEPDRGESLDDFLAREADRYRRQLALYLALIRLYDERRRARAALYFPMIDHLLELDHV